MDSWNTPNLLSCLLGADTASLFHSHLIFIHKNQGITEKNYLEENFSIRFKAINLFLKLYVLKSTKLKREVIRNIRKVTIT